MSGISVRLKKASRILFEDGMPTVIKIENLSKKYIIGHQKQRRYVALRDVIADSARKLRKRIISPFHKNLESSYVKEEFWALKDINFEVKNNDCVGIIGRNGAGKSTLLKILSRITEPTKGRVSIQGRVASLLEVGTGFHPELTGKENIFLNGAILGMRKWEIKKKFDEIVSFAEIEKFIDTLVKRYSSGMYMRLAFAVAAHLEPEILLVDEVLSVGDMPFQKKCLGRMQDIAKGGRTVLFVSHNMDVVRKLCARVIILHEGRVVMDGDTDEAINKYLGEGMGLVGEQVWPDIYKAPGDNVARLVAARALDQNGKVCVNYDVRDPISIEIKYKVLEEGHHLYMHLSFFNEREQVIFVTKDNLDSPWRDTVCPVGDYRAICQIPGDFLNEGEFSVFCAGMDVGMTNLDHFWKLDLLIFRVSDRMDNGGVRGNFPLGWPPGGVRPRLQWTVEKKS